MTKVVVLPLLLGGMLLAGCNRTEDSNGAASSPAPAKPAAVSVDAPAVDAPPVEQTPDAPAPDAPAAAPSADKPVVLPPFINANGPPASTSAEGAPAKRTAAAPAGNPLPGLTAALRAYEKSHQKLPDSLDELTTAGLITAVPEPPAGMTYVIDAARREVVLKKL